MAIPPIRAVDLLCHRSSVGFATHPFLIANLRTNGVAMRQMMKEIMGK